MPADLKAVPSPCINVCIYNQASGHCQGCYRTMAEIAGWLQMEDAERLATLEACQVRREIPLDQ